MNYYKMSIPLPGVPRSKDILVKSDKFQRDALRAAVGSELTIYPGEYVSATCNRFYTPLGYAYVREIFGDDLLQYTDSEFIGV